MEEDLSLSVDALDPTTIWISDKLFVSVIIITKNRCEDLNRCLKSLFDQTMKDFEVIVVDGESSDSTLNVVNGYRVRLFVDKTKDLSYLRNFGAGKARGDVIAFIDDDAQADKQWLEQAVSTLQEKPFLVAVGGPTVIIGKQTMLGLYVGSTESIFLKIFRSIYETVVAENNLFEICKFFSSGAFSIGSSLPWSRKIRGLVDVDYLSSCNFAIRKGIFLSFNGFDSAFPTTHHDTDFFLRIKKKKLKFIFNPKMVVFHHVNQNAKTRPKSFELASDFAFFYCRHCRIRNIAGALRLIVNICMLNMFWVYQAMKTGNLKCLSWTVGFLQGFKRFLKTDGLHPRIMR